MIFVTISLLLTVASCQARDARQHAPPAHLDLIDDNINNAAWTDTFRADNVPDQFGRTIESSEYPTIDQFGQAGNVASHELRTTAPNGWFGQFSGAVNRQSLPAPPSFFALAPQYVVGLVTTFTFVLGVILFFDLIFGDANIIQRITGQRGAKAIQDMVSGMDVNTVISAADEVYNAIEKYQDLQKSQLPK
jgi:hypothetical protein